MSGSLSTLYKISWSQNFLHIHFPPDFKLSVVYRRYVLADTTHLEETDAVYRSRGIAFILKIQREIGYASIFLYFSATSFRKSPKDQHYAVKLSLRISLPEESKTLFLLYECNKLFSKSGARAVSKCFSKPYIY